jgi:hypothetical protein
MSKGDPNTGKSEVSASVKRDVVHRQTRPTNRGIPDSRVPRTHTDERS